MSFISDIEAGIKTLFTATSAGFMNDASAGQNQLSHWAQELRGANSPALRPILAELENLQRCIGAGDAAGMAATFQTLGTLTAAAASNTHTFEGTGDKLRELSQKLITAGGNMRHIAGAKVAAH